FGDGTAAVERRAHLRPGMVAEEHETAAGAQQAVRLGQPGLRVAPDGGAVFADREVEGGVRERRRFGVAVHEGEVDAVMGGEAAGGGELLGGVVDGAHPRAAARHPAGDVAGAAAE
ncbi:hypothetical protein RZS08_01330, partial [Arthrospira platensis SPKY1]|nr:hypothetical protein [Arthrospira platensis SPKY1]